MDLPTEPIVPACLTLPAVSLSILILDYTILATRL